MTIPSILRASLAILTVVLTACTGDAGPVGPQGETGLQGAPGPQGPAGPQGVAGNADVVVYTFGERIFTDYVLYELPDVSMGTIDSSLVQVHYNASTTAWYPMPGVGEGGDYDTRYFIYRPPSGITTLVVRLSDPATGAAYASPVRFTKLKVVIARASSIVVLPEPSALGLMTTSR
jgi:hypothetical protein